MHILSNNYDKTKELLSSFDVEFSDHKLEINGPIACGSGLDVLRDVLIEHGDTLIVAITTLWAGRKIKVNFTTDKKETRAITDESTPETIKETIKSSKSMLIYWED